MMLDLHVASSSFSCSHHHPHMSGARLSSSSSRFHYPLARSGSERFEVWTGRAGVVRESQGHARRGHVGFDVRMPGAKICLPAPACLPCRQSRGRCRHETRSKKDACALKSKTPARGLDPGEGDGGMRLGAEGLLPSTASCVSSRPQRDARARPSPGICSIRWLSRPSILPNLASHQAMQVHWRLKEKTTRACPPSPPPTIPKRRIRWKPSD